MHRTAERDERAQPGEGHQRRGQADQSGAKHGESGEEAEAEPHRAIGPGGGRVEVGISDAARQRQAAQQAEGGDQFRSSWTHVVFPFRSG